MKTRTMVKSFHFTEPQRSELTLGPGARLHPTRHVLTLVGEPGTFPTDDDIQARTRLWQPSSARAWLGFEAIARYPVIDGGSPTRLAFRLSDGVDDFFWNGSAWEPTTVIDGDWSIEEEVATNIGEFFNMLGARKLQIVVNVQSDDKRVAPELITLKVLWSSDIEPQEDLVVRSLIPDLKAKLQPRADATLTFAAAVSSFALADLALETPYDVLTIDSVFNHTADPSHFDDLLASYNTGTKIATLLLPIPAGNLIWVRFLYRPLVAITTSQDFDEVSAIPAVIIRDVSAIVASERSIEDSVVNRDTGASVVVPAPIQGDLDMRIEWHTDKQTDHQRLADELKRYFGTTPLLRSRGLDEDFRLWLVDEYATAFPADADERDLLRGELGARIVGALLFHKEARNAQAITAFKMSASPAGTEGRSIVALQRVYWGNKVPTGPFNAAFITTLSDNALGRTAARVFDASAAVGEKIYYAFPQAFGTARFRVGGFEGGFFMRATAVDIDGVSYDLWESDSVSLGPTRVVAT